MLKVYERDFKIKGEDMKIRKIFFPKWVAWFMLIIFIPILFVMEYEAFFGEKPYPTMGFVFGFMFIAIIVMMFLVSYRKLPYLWIEEK